MTQCEFEGCKYTARARGLCRRHGEMTTGIPCSVPDCDNPVRARGWCAMHYYRWSKTGDPGDAKRLRNGKRPCKVVDCQNDAITRDDLCPTHRRRKRLYGSEDGSFATSLPCAVCGKPSMHGAIAVDRCEDHVWDRVIDLYMSGEYRGATDADSGYVYLSVRKKRKAAHRAVMARLLGRELLSKETPHHVNGQRDDNHTDGPLVNFRSGNLELWSSAQPPGQRVSDKVAFAVELLQTYAPHLLADSHAVSG